MIRNKKLNMTVYVIVSPEQAHGFFRYSRSGRIDAING